MIAAYTQSVCKNKMNRIKPRYLAREKDLISKFSEYFNLGKIDQIENLVYFCVDIGCYTSNLTTESFKLVPKPNLQEIQENESAYFCLDDRLNFEPSPMGPCLLFYLL